jgi:Protein of unknown function (DUF992)
MPDRVAVKPFCGAVLAASLGLLSVQAVAQDAAIQFRVVATDRNGVNSDMTQTTPKVYTTNFGLGGASAQGTVGVGAGANVLVGGSSNQIALQPVSIEGSVGLNVAAGVAALSLTKTP